MYTFLWAVGNFSLRYHPQNDAHTHTTSKYSIIQNRQNGKNILSLYNNYTVTFPCNRILYSNLSYKLLLYAATWTDFSDIMSRVK